MTDWTPFPLPPQFSSDDVYLASQLRYRVLAGGVAQLMGAVKTTDGSAFDPRGETLCGDLPPELLWRSTANESQYQRCMVSQVHPESHGAVHLLLIDGMEGVMTLLPAQDGIEAVDLTATWAVDPDQ